MRDRETIDSELRRIASLRRSIREQGGQPSYGQADKLLDERLAAASGAFEAWDAEVVGDAPSQNNRTRHRHTVALHRLSVLAAMPLSLVAAVAVVVVIFAVRHPHTAAQPTIIPPSVAPPPPAAPPKPPAPPASAPPLAIVDRAFIDALKHDGLPIPSPDYVMSHGHAVCDFLAHQPNVADAVAFVQRTSIWDADQSANFTAGAIVSYCPQYESAGPSDDMQQTFQDAISNLQAIEGDLQGIHDDLQGIPGHG
ncbi:DUF732 domain-containing protein [Mycobacterium fragae]|uniref:DUF732 domain-containing protein n=1 Tax=Mycobacterium fragae TaxID=1260918 RepID=A0A1X1UPH2_9MYCO|nr:DUF732 domain-containing protein [Mycobacterium fragae]MCV7400118.1 DUF732 domain-containing protein [Mycobacterium fragae]ORV58568.1 hypothetical protein AWC06_19425 [Mycobacterium fragae]